MKKIFSIFAFALLFVLQSCDKDLPTDTTLNSYVGFEMDKTLDLPKDETFVIPVKVYASESSSIARTYVIEADPVVTTLSAQYYSMPASVTIPANEVEATIEVSITSTNLGDGKKLKIQFPQQAGLNQATSFTSTNGVVTSVVSRGITLNITEQCLFNRVKLTINFDSYPDETAWELYDSNNVVIDSGGLNAAGTAIVGYTGTSFSKNMCLPSGSYTFVIYDSYGDGMFTSASVQGNYKLELVGGAVLVTGGGNFGSSAVHNFVIP